MEIEHMKNNEIEVNGFDLVKFLKFRKTDRYKGMLEYMKAEHIFEIMITLNYHSRGRLTIEELWDNFIEEYDDDHEYWDWMYYLVREISRFNREGFKTLTSSRVIPMFSIIEALAVLDNEELDFN